MGFTKITDANPRKAFDPHPTLRHDEPARPPWIDPHGQSILPRAAR